MARVWIVTLFSAVLIATASAKVLRPRAGPVNCTGECQTADQHARMTRIMKLKLEMHKKCVEEHKCPLTGLSSLSNIPCTDGKAGEYDCSNVDMQSFVTFADLGCNGDLNDIWGWTDPDSKKEYAIVGCDSGTSFVDVTEPEEPKVLGFLGTATSNSLWRDIKVYNDHAFIVSEASNHGMQVYDLKQLSKLQPTLPGGKVEPLKETTHYSEFGSAHNIIANEETGFMYVVGTRTCTSGLHIVNVEDPSNPVFAGCFGEDGYVHDAQCVIYRGPDTIYQGKEICFCYNENTLTIVDVSNKDEMEILSRMSYNGYQYTHQGWLNEQQTHLLLNDELDELYGSNKHTRSMVWKVEELSNPELTWSFYSEKQATDHNLYIRANLAYESNYCAGLRILNIEKMDVKDGISEVGFFDVEPGCDAPGFSGAWSSYPYFDSGNIIVSSIERGLFVLKYTGTE